MGGIRGNAGCTGQHCNRLGSNEFSRLSATNSANSALMHGISLTAVFRLSPMCLEARSAVRFRSDKTFLFENYEGFRQTLGYARVTLVPDAYFLWPVRCSSLRRC